MIARAWALLLLAALLSSTARNARADFDFPSTTESLTFSSAFNPANPYPRGLRLVTIYGGFAEEPTGEREQLSFCNVGLNYYFADNWAFGFEATGFLVDQNDHDSAAGGANILLRTHLWNYERFSFFGDFTAGILEANHTIPPSGTDFNFTVRTGIGAVYDFDPHIGLIVGLRYMHLSNARQEGPSRNPSLNAIEGYAGFIFRM